MTPPRQSGPSEAERKIEALTQQLEEEFEKEEESEYFGKSETIFLDFAPIQIIYFSILKSRLGFDISLFDRSTLT